MKDKEFCELLKIANFTEKLTRKDVRYYKARIKTHNFLVINKTAIGIEKIDGNLVFSKYEKC